VHAEVAKAETEKTNDGLAFKAQEAMGFINCFLGKDLNIIQSTSYAHLLSPNFGPASPMPFSQTKHPPLRAPPTGAAFFRANIPHSRNCNQTRRRSSQEQATSGIMQSSSMSTTSLERRRIAHVPLLKPAADSDAATADRLIRDSFPRGLGTPLRSKQETGW